MTEDPRHRLAEILSSGGVGYGQVSQEVLYMLPREFLDKYVQLWYMALGPLIQGQGQQMTRDGELGRAKTRTTEKGRKIGAGAGGEAKRYRKSGYSIRNELAFQLKDRIDKRLRGIARELRLTLSDLEARQNTAYGSVKAGGGAERRMGEETGANGNTTESTGNALKSTRGMRRCIKCGRYGVDGWAFCPYDGKALIREKEKENPED